MNLKSIKLNGRYHIDGEHLYFYNVGSGFSFKMNGQSFSVLLKAIPEPGYYYIIVDRDYKNKTKILTAQSPYIYEFKNSGEHLVDIVKANESNDNALEFVGLEVNGELLEFDHCYSGAVKVFGDSTIAGFGILSHESPASIENSDGVCDFCYHALYELDIEMDILCASGYGLAFSSYTNPKTIGIYDFHNKVAVHKDISWEDDSKYDLLIISLGCNDNAFIHECTNKEERIDEFRLKYRKLIDSQLEHNKGLKILMLYGTLKEESAYYLYEGTYNYLKPFYKNLFIHRFNGDNSAISNHAYVSAHDEMSKELKKVIKEII